MQKKLVIGLRIKDHDEGGEKILNESYINRISLYMVKFYNIQKKKRLI